MFEQQISSGMQWLDEQYPGWEQRVDPAKLKLHSCTECVLGQLGGYGEVLDVQIAAGNISHGVEEWSQSRGFYLVGGGNALPHYRILTDEWRAAILARRNPVTPAKVAAPAARQSLTSLCLR